MSESPSLGFWDKLRRRKVVQWSIAYVAAGWGLLQGLEYVADAFGWPEQIQRFAIVAFVVGLPIVLVLAWYHGDRGQQRVSGTEFALLTGLLLIGGGLFWRLDRVAEPAATAAAGADAAREAPEPQAGPSVAVLPFVNMSGDQENEYFSDGISEELLNVLVRVPGLGVASRTSSFAYKGSNLGAGEIAKELKVSHVLEGSVRKSGNRVRITAQFIDAGNDRHLWSETYDRELTDIFGIQEEIANSIVDALQAQLGATQAAKQVTVRADTENLRAYDLYLKARELFISRSNVGESIRLFERVTRIDAGFSRGWEGLAAAASVAPSWGIVDRDYLVIAEQAAKRALRLDPTLSMPWAVLGTVAQERLPVDWDRNLELFGKAIAADPRNSTALLWRAIAWANLGFFDRAEADLDHCLSIDPGYSNCTRWKAVVRMWSGDTGTALRLFDEGVQAGFAESHGASFVVPLIHRGERRTALLYLNLLGAGPEGAVVFARAIAAPDGPVALTERDQATVDRLLTSGDENFLGNISPPIARLWLRQYDKVVDDPLFDAAYVYQWQVGLRGWPDSPGFKAVVDRLGLPAYWRRHGYPPMCRPAGADGYSCRTADIRGAVARAR